MNSIESNVNNEIITNNTEIYHRIFLNTLKELFEIRSWSTNYTHTHITPEMKASIIFLSNQNMFIDINNWNDYEKFLNNVNYHIDLNSLITELNSLDTIFQESTFLTKIKKINNLALNHLLLLNIYLHSKFRDNLEHFNQLNDALVQLENTEAVEYKYDRLFTFFHNLWLFSFKNLYELDFTKKIHLNFHTIFSCIHSLQTDDEKIKDLLFSKTFQFEKFYLADMHLFKELLLSFSRLKPVDNVEKIISVPIDGFLNLKLLKRIIETPQLHDLCKNLPFDIELTYFFHLKESEQIEIFMNDSKTILKMLQIYELPYDKKISYLKKNYFNYFSTNQICKDNIYKELLELLINPVIDQKDFNELIDYFISVYSEKIVPDLYVTPSLTNYVKSYFTNFNDDDFLILIDKINTQCGYTQAFAKLIDDLNIFREKEKLNCLFQSNLYIIENFLSNYNHFIQLDFYNHEQIFKNLIDLFQQKIITASTITKVFDWIQSVPDLILSNELIEKFSLMLIDRFELNSLGLIPDYFLNEDIALKIFDKCMINQSTLLSPSEKLNYLRNYDSKDNTFEPSIFNLLPTELKYHVGTFLKPHDLKALSLTSKDHFKLFKNLLTFSRNNNNIKRVFSYFFNAYPWDININYNENNYNINPSDLINDLLKEEYNKLSEEEFNEISKEEFNKISEELFNKIDKESLSLLEQNKCLEIIYNVINSICLKIHHCEIPFRPNFHNILDPFEIEHCLIQIFNKYFEIDISKKKDDDFYYCYLIELVDRLNLNFSENFIEDLILFYAEDIVGFDSEVLENISTRKEAIEFFEEIKDRKLFNLTNIRKMILSGEANQNLLYVYFKATSDHMNPNFLKDFLGLFSFDYILESDLEEDFPKNFEWRFNFLQQIFTFRSLDKLYYTEFKDIIQFLSIDEDYKWMEREEYIDFLTIQGPVKFLKFLVNDGHRYGLKKPSSIKIFECLNLALSGVTYDSILFDVIQRYKFEINHELIFNFAMQAKINICVFMTDLKFYMSKTLIIDFECIKKYFETDIINKFFDHSHLAECINRLVSLVELSVSQKIELVKILFKRLKLTHLEFLGQTSIFNDIARKNDELFISLIEECLNDPSQLAYFKKDFEVIKSLIGIENAKKIKQKFAATKRQLPTTSTINEPAPKKKKGN